jgi:PST family polysaccharide transporter
LTQFEKRACSAAARPVSLARTSFLNAVAVLVRLASALALNKILAAFVGPSGYALIGQMQSVVSMIAGITAGSLSNGVIKGTAEHFDDARRQWALWRTAARLSLYATLVVGIVLMAIKEPLAAWLFHRHELAAILMWLVAVLPAISANALLLAILNGKKDVSTFVTTSILGSALGLAVTAILAAAYGVRGALIAVAINPAISILASAALISRRAWFKPRYLWGEGDRESARELAKYALMALTTALCTPIGQMLIRDHLGHTFGLASAGYWHALSKISEAYLLFITMTLAMYYLPRIAEIRRAEELKAEIGKVYRFALPFAAAAAILIYLMRDTLVVWLFTPEFAPMRELFGWQLAGDVLKVAAWVLAYVLVGKAASAAFISTEIVFTASLVLLTWLLTGSFGLKGAVVAHFANYTLYLVAIAILVRRLVRVQPVAA